MANEPRDLKGVPMIDLRGGAPMWPAAVRPDGQFGAPVKPAAMKPKVVPAASAAPPAKQK